MSDEITITVEEEVTTVTVQATGVPGPTGTTGPGVPAGGTTGQVLAKASATDHDTEWVDQTAGSGVSNGDKGDITVSGGGLTWTIDSNVISSFGRTLTDDADASAARATLGLGTAATSASSAFAAASHTHAQSDITNLTTDLAAKQPLDADLTSIAGLDKTGNSLKVLRVNVGETAYELAAVSGGTGEPSDGDKGDITVASSGTAWTIDTDSVTNAKLANVATSTIKGRVTASTGDPEDLTATQVRTLLNVADGANAYTHPNHSGDVTSSGDGATTIANDAVTYAKMQNVSATDKLLGRSTAGSGDVEEIACTAAGRALLDDANAAAQLTTLGAAAASHTHAQADVTNLVTDLAGKAASSHTHAQSDVTNLTTDLGNKQPLDADLTTIAGLTATTDNFLQAKSSAWASRTVAQVKTDLALTGTNSGDVSLAGTPDYITLSGQTITRGAIDLATDVTGVLPHGNLGTGGGGSTKFLREDGTFQTIAAGGDVAGPASSTDNGLPRFDSTTGKVLQTSYATIDDDGEIRTANNSGANVGVVPAEHFMILDADYTLTSTTSEQKLFNATTNGRLTLPAGTYLFDCTLSLASMSGTSGYAQFDLLGAGSATFDAGRTIYRAHGNSGVGGVYGSGTTGTQSSTLLAWLTDAAIGIQLSGTFTISTGGTIIPSITLQTAAASVVKEGSYFSCRRIGSHTVTSVGAWD